MTTAHTNTTATSTATQPRWDLDLAHSSVGFWVRHLMISKVHGRFAKWSGSLELDENALERSKVSVSIDAASIDTQEPRRDEHLRSADFFDVAKYPQLSFTSKQVRKTSATQLRVTGDLSMHGVTKSVELEVEYLGTQKDPWGGTRAGFSAKTTVDRRDFGLTWNQALETGGVLVGDTVTIELEIQAIRAKE